MSVPQNDRSLMRKETTKFAIITAISAASLVLGLALIIFANYHERAYIFLVLGAGGLIGGVAGMIVVGQKVRVVLDYGLIAMGFVAMVVGLNYLIGVYGTEPNLIRGFPVIALSTIAILIGILRELELALENIREYVVTCLYVYPSTICQARWSLCQDAAKMGSDQRVACETHDHQSAVLY